MAGAPGSRGLVHEIRNWKRKLETGKLETGAGNGHHPQEGSFGSGSRPPPGGTATRPPPEGRPLSQAHSARLGPRTPSARGSSGPGGRAAATPPPPASSRHGGE